MKSDVKLAEIAKNIYNNKSLKVKLFSYKYFLISFNLSEEHLYNDEKINERLECFRNIKGFRFYYLDGLFVALHIENNIELDVLTWINSAKAFEVRDLFLMNITYISEVYLLRNTSLYLGIKAEKYNFVYDFYINANGINKKIIVTKSDHNYLDGGVPIYYSNVNEEVENKSENYFENRNVYFIYFYFEKDWKQRIYKLPYERLITKLKEDFYE